MDDAALSVEQLDALSRAVPEDAERRDLLAYLAVGRTCLATLSSELALLCLLAGSPHLFSVRSPCTPCSMLAECTLHKSAKWWQISSSGEASAHRVYACAGRALAVQSQTSRLLGPRAHLSAC